MLEFDNKRLNILIGMLLIVISIALIFAYNHFKNSKVSLNTNIYKVYVPSIVGIKKNQPVSVGGYPIGYVKDITIDNYSPMLTLSVDKDIEITADAKIQISNVSLFSSAKVISVVNGIDDNLLTNNSYIADANLGVDLDQLLNMIEMYLKQKIK